MSVEISFDMLWFLHVCCVVGCLNDSAGEHLSNGAPPAKRSKLEGQEEGDKIIADFLDNVHELASLDISDVDMKMKFDKLKLDFIHTDNAYIKAVLNTIS